MARAMLRSSAYGVHHATVRSMTDDEALDVHAAHFRAWASKTRREIILAAEARVRYEIHRAP